MKDYTNGTQMSSDINNDVDEKFQGFPPFELNEKGAKIHFTMCPNGWNRAIQKMEGNEVKVVWYIMEHTWGWQEDGEHVRTRRISTNEFMYGRKLKGSGKRVDEGTGLSEKTVIASLKKATDHGYIFCEDDDSDPARRGKAYGLVMLEDRQSNLSVETSDLQMLQSKSSSNPSFSDLQMLQSKSSSDLEKLQIIGSVNVTDRTKQENLTSKTSLIKENITHLSLLEIENNNLAEKAIQFILKGKKNNKPLTFTDIESFLRRVINTKGTNVIPYKNNVILWSWISEQFADILKLVLEDENIIIEPGTIGYNYDNTKKHPHYPIAQQGKDYTNEETHWLPIVFYHKNMKSYG